LQPPAICAT